MVRFEKFQDKRGLFFEVNILSLTTRGGDMGQKLHFQDNIGVWVLKIFASKNDLFCLGIFQIQLFWEEIWDKNCIFQDNMGLWVVNIFNSIYTKTHEKVTHTHEAPDAAGQWFIGDDEEPHHLSMASSFYYDLCYSYIITNFHYNEFPLHYVIFIM